MKTKKYPSKEKIRELFDYRDGQLFWKISPAKSVKAGSVVGTTDPNGYVRTMLKGQRLLVHRLIYIYHHGDISEAIQIDHIDGRRDFNRIENLRLVTNQENCFNQKAKGYSYCKRSGKWGAYIGVDGKNKFLGYFDIACDARNAYMIAKSSLHTIQAHG